MMSTLAWVVAAALAAAPVSLQFNGRLDDALRQVAQQGGLNVVVEGELPQAVRVDLHGLPADEALTALARVHHVELSHEGALWVLRAPQGSPPGAAAAATPTAVREPASPAGALPPPTGPVAPTPPLPPAPVSPEHAGSVLEDLDRQVAQAESAVEQAQALRERVREEATARRERIRALKAAARARAQAESDSDRELTGKGTVVVKAGAVVESATAFGGPVMVEKGAVVEGDAVAFGGDVVLQDDAVVEGDAVSFGGQVVRATSAKVEGEEVSFSGHGVPRVAASAASAASEGGGRVASFFASFAVLYVLGFLGLMVAPQRMRRIEEAVRRAPVRLGLLGFLAALALVPLTVLLAITIIGIPVVVLMWLLLPLAVLFGFPAIANVIGAAIPLGRARRTQALVLAVGLAILLVAANLPLFGIPVTLFVTLLSLGAMLATRLGQPVRGMPMPDADVTQPMPG